MKIQWALPIIALLIVSPTADAGPRERVYEVPPAARPLPLDFALYCSDEDCSDDRDRRCIDRGHGSATDHVFHFSQGTGNCLITCDDGYLLLVVEDGCSAQDSGRLVATARAWPPRRRELWFAPAGARCADAHDLAGADAVCPDPAVDD